MTTEEPRFVQKDHVISKMVRNIQRSYSWDLRLDDIVSFAV